MKTPNQIEKLNDEDPVQRLLCELALGMRKSLRSIIEAKGWRSQESWRQERFEVPPGDHTHRIFVRPFGFIYDGSRVTDYFPFWDAILDRVGLIDQRTSEAFDVTARVRWPTNPAGYAAEFHIDSAGNASFGENEAAGLEVVTPGRLLVGATAIAATLHAGKNKVGVRSDSPIRYRAISEVLLRGDPTGGLADVEAVKAQHFVIPQQLRESLDAMAVLMQPDTSA